ncbi:hypothetical protein L1049_003301 [Liquidambar formosana]|uniref:Uncharacterized protein n=1 Tax=Liquidambar formosana TaxID=63359 RepID=A0AAP0R7F0_LIQFO
MRQLVSAGGIFGCQDFTARKAIVSRLRMQGNGSSPGTSFRISDSEIFLYTGIENGSDASVDHGSGGMSSHSTERSQLDSTNEDYSPSSNKKPGSVNYAAQRLKGLLHWPKMKQKKPDRFKKPTDEGSLESSKKWSNSSETPIPLRQRFSKPSSLPNNKRTLSVRSNLPSPTAKKKFATGIIHGVMQAMPQLTIPGHSSSSSFSKSSVSSPRSLDKQKEVCIIGNDIAGPSCSNPIFDDGTPNLIHKQGSANKRLMNQYFCFGAPGLSVKDHARGQQPNQNYKRSVLSMA